MSDLILGGEDASRQPSKQAGPIDWGKLKSDVIARLDVEVEYKALGLRFTGRKTGARKLEAHGMGREDVDPSAFVNLDTGVYVDSGAKVKLHLFDFAAQYSSLGNFGAVAKHYSEKAGIEIGRIQTGSRGKILEATYDYQNEDGSISYRVFRYILPNGKKDFRQAPPDGKGGWRFGEGAMKGVAMLPYRLPDILASDPDEPIFITEGEKAAEALWDLGLTATTHSGGSQNADHAWPVISRYFADRDVYILPDNDHPGIEAARAVANALAGIARLTKVVILPDLPIKGDAVEWIADGGTAEELGRLAHAAPEYREGVLDEKVATLDDPENRDATALDLIEKLSNEGWLWPGWIAAGALTLLAAGGGTGKTRFMMDLHRRLYHGMPMPDGFELPERIERPRFLWIAADNQYPELVEIPRDFGIPHDLVSLNATAAEPFGGTTLETAEEYAALEARIKRLKPTLVVIDTITNTGLFKSESTVDAMRQYKPLQEMALRNGVPIMVVTHLSASGKALGVRAIEKVRVVIAMTQPDPEGQPNRRKLWVDKSKAKKPPALGISMGDDGNEYDLDPPKPPEDGRTEGSSRGPVSSKLPDCMAKLKEMLAGGGAIPLARIRKQLVEVDGYSVNTMYSARDALDVFEEDSPSGRGKVWSLRPDIGLLDLKEGA